MREVAMVTRNLHAVQFTLGSCCYACKTKCNCEMKMSAFWYAAPCSVAEVNRCFEGAHCLHNQGGEGP
jgi:hypothetical protein